MMLKTTPLIKEHTLLNARFVNFHGWKLPLEFSLNAHAEHIHTRTHVGLFDISHLSQIRIQGLDALLVLEKLFTNRVQSLSPYRGQYNLMCNPRGGIVDDGILYCVKFKTEYLFVGNGSQQTKDLQWMKNHNVYPKTCHIQDESSQHAMLALQGPLAVKLLEKVLNSSSSSSNTHDFKLSGLDQFGWKFVPFYNQKILVSRTGYTGEDGFELILCAEIAKNLWRAFLDPKYQIKCLPVGLSARDTLRMEMKYPLYGVDLNEGTNPYSAGLGWAVKNPASFIGSQALQKKEDLLKRKWVGFRLKNLQSGVPRQKYRIFKNGSVIGEVTSGAKSPFLNQMIGLGYVDSRYCDPGTPIEVEIHRQLIAAEVVVTPFIKK